MLAFQSGDDRAFDEIVRGHESAVRQFLFRYVRDRHRAEDLTQEVFVRVFRSRCRYEATAGFRTWLFTIATRLALNEIRGLRRRRRVFADVDTSDAVGAAPWDLALDRRTPGPRETAESHELGEALSRLIDDLPENQRAAVILSRVEDLPYREIAAVLGVSTMAVKSLLMRARETLRRRLERYLQGRSLVLAPKPFPSTEAATRAGEARESGAEKSFRDTPASPGEALEAGQPLKPANP